MACVPPSPRISSNTPILFSQIAAPAPRVQHQQQQQQRYSTRISQTDTHQNLSHNEVPSAEQRRAIASLQGIPIPDILALLERIRSWLRGEPGFDPNHLSPEKLQAGLALEDCSNEHVHAWLNDARPPGEGQDSSAAKSRKYDRWCFICKSSASLHTSLDNYRRHVRKHYTRWYCIPQGTLVRTKDRPRCETCHISDPDPKHLNKHNIHTCVNKSFTRKENLIDHYKKYHRFRNCSELATHSRYTVDLKHFACGFCDLYCSSLDGLINHVDAEHFKYLPGESRWDDDKVIRTLLSVNKYWRDVLAARPDRPGSAFTWNARHVKELQRRLAKDREPADALCKAAIDKSNFGMSQHDYVESGVTRELLSQPWDWERLNSLPWNENIPSIPMDSETYGPPSSGMEYDAGPRMQPIDMPSSGERFVHHQHLAQPHAGLYYPALIAQSTSSPLPSNREASSLGQPSSTYSPEHRLTIAAQVSRPEMRDGRG